MTLTRTHDQDTRRRRTVVWAVALATTGMVFDGYDLVAYGAVVPTFLKDPSQLGEVTPAVAGTLGSYALLGMLFGALLAGAFGDIVGRRRVMLTAYAWFSIGMAVTAFMHTTTTFGIFRFVTLGWRSRRARAPRRLFRPAAVLRTRQGSCRSRPNAPKGAPARLPVRDARGSGAHRLVSERSRPDALAG